MYSISTHIKSATTTIKIVFKMKSTVAEKSYMVDQNHFYKFHSLHVYFEALSTENNTPKNPHDVLTKVSRRNVQSIKKKIFVVGTHLLKISYYLNHLHQSLL